MSSSSFPLRGRLPILLDFDEPTDGVREPPTFSPDNGRLPLDVRCESFADSGVRIVAFGVELFELDEAAFGVDRFEPEFEPVGVLGGVPEKK